MSVYKTCLPDTGDFEGTVLVAPLEWGLGHAARCMPVIRHFLQKGKRVLIAAGPEGRRLLEQEFPECEQIHGPSFSVRYARDKRITALKILFGLPRLLRLIGQEHRWLDGLIRVRDIGLVVSDNRYGLYSDEVRCVIMTHQLRVRTPLSWLDDAAQKINYRWLERFSECWVPDAEQDGGLAGELSHPEYLPKVPVRYIGPLSRVSASRAQGGTQYDWPGGPVGPQFNWLFLISGPEPQRTLLEEKLIKAAGSRKVLLARGAIGKSIPLAVPSNITVVDHLDAAGLGRAFACCQFVACRAGYTSIMELACANKPALLIPTPGQTEQEYLAEHLRNTALFRSCLQDDDIEAAITEMEKG